MEEAVGEGGAEGGAGAGKGAFSSLSTTIGFNFIPHGVALAFPCEGVLVGTSSLANERAGGGVADGGEKEEEEEEEEEKEEIISFPEV